MSPFSAGLGPAVEEHVTVLVPGLGGESDHDLAGPRRVAHQPGQDVRVGGELNGHGRFSGVLHSRGCLLLELGGGHGDRPVVGDGGSHDDGVGVAGGVAHDAEHVRGGTGCNNTHLRRQGFEQFGGHVRLYQGDAGSLLGSGRRQSAALAP